MVEKSYFVSANVVARKEARFFNFVVDYISIFLILVLISILNMVFFLDIDSEVVDSSIIPEGNTLAEYIIFSLQSISYYFVLEVLTGRTIGKWLTGSIVVDISGNKPPTSTILKRSLLRLIPFEYLSFLGHRARGWHDQYSDTYVVYKKKLEAEKSTFEDLESLGLQSDI
jgi:uncharacterized RDD family membrane protein YckC